MTPAEKLKFFALRKKEGNPEWKGDSASYSAKHKWVQSNFGNKKICEKCGNKDKKMYHWANLSGEYKRERSDWARLCVSCHKIMDLKRVKPTTPF